MPQSSNTAGNGVPFGHRRPTTTAGNDITMFSTAELLVKLRRDTRNLDEAVRLNCSSETLKFYAGVLEKSAAILKEHYGRDN